jgi:protein-disulfide isomerase
VSTEATAARVSEQKPPDRRRSAVVWAAVVAALVLLVILAVRLGSDSGPPLPDGVDALDAGLAVGDDAPVVLDEWFDFACPACATASEALSRTIGDLVDSGDVQVVYHPLSFVTPTGSALAANAFGCASDEGLAREFHAAVLSAQGEDGDEFTNDQLIDIGADVGIEGESFAECVTQQTYQEWVDNVAASGLDAGIAVTPTFVVNGEPVVVDDNDPQVLREQVTAASAGERPLRGVPTDEMMTSLSVRRLYTLRERPSPTSRPSPGRMPMTSSWLAELSDSVSV